MKKKGPRREEGGKTPTLKEWTEEEQPVEETEKVWPKVKERISTVLSFSLL